DHAPVDGTAALDVTAADDQVGPLLGGGQELGQVLGIVREIAVHLEDELVVAGKRPAETRDVGGAEPLLAGPVQDVHLAVLGGDAVRHGAGPVGRVVVHDQEVGMGEVLVNRSHDLRQVLLLVVGGDDYEHGRHGGEEPTRSCGL